MSQSPSSCDQRIKQSSGRHRAFPQDEWPAFFRIGDKHVLAALGITPPKALPHRTEVLLGTGRVPGCDNATVAVYVTAYPARFWRIQINRKDSAKFELNAGTVELQKLWSTIELICRGMLDVRIVWPNPDQSSCEHLDQAEVAEEPAPLPLVSLGQGEYAHDLAGNSAPVDSPADLERKRLRRALRRIAFEPFGDAMASDRQILDSLTVYAREILVGGAA